MYVKCMYLCKVKLFAFPDILISWKRNEKLYPLIQDETGNRTYDGFDKNVFFRHSISLHRRQIKKKRRRKKQR